MDRLFGETTSVAFTGGGGACCWKKGLFCGTTGTTCLAGATRIGWVEAAGVEPPPARKAFALGIC